LKGAEKRNGIYLPVWNPVGAGCRATYQPSLRDCSKQLLLSIERRRSRLGCSCNWLRRWLSFLTPAKELEWFHVPDTFQLGPTLPVSAFLASRIFN